MKKILILSLGILLFSCSRNDNINNCNFLLNVSVNDLIIDLNLPVYSQLQFTGNSREIDGPGNGRIIVARTGSDNLRAWDGADPNHPLSSCSLLTPDGLTATCGCEDGNQYELLSGQSLGENQQPCTLLPYRVEFIGNNRYRISN